MPLLIALGIVVVVAAVAIFKVNQWQAGRYVKLAQQAKAAKEAEDAVDAEGVKDAEDTDSDEKNDSEH